MRSFADRLRKMACKAFPNYDDVAREQFQDRQYIYIKQMVAHRSLDECILAISRYEDKSAGYGLSQENTVCATLARSRDARAENVIANAPNVEESLPNVSLVGDDIKPFTRRMSDMWLDPALALVEYDDNGIFDTDAVFSILQANVDRMSNQTAVCYFC